jgi:broad specificity phosphatase PhoE
MRDALKRLIAQGTDTTGARVVVSHGGAIRSLLLSLTGELPPPLGNGATFRLHWDGADFRDIERVR